MFTEKKRLLKNTVEWAKLKTHSDNIYVSFQFEQNVCKIKFLFENYNEKHSNRASIRYGNFNIISLSTFNVYTIQNVY